MMEQREKYAPRGLLSEFVGGEQRDPVVAKRVLNGDVQLDIYGKTCDRVSQLLFNTMSHHHCVHLIVLVHEIAFGLHMVVVHYTW